MTESSSRNGGAKGRALILVVERDPHVRALESYFLERAGYEVQFTDDGVQALAEAKALVPDIVISEILVPGLDGLSVCRALKQDPATRGVVVLIFSILAAEKRALEAGADAFLRKPLEDTLLVQSVEKLLSQQRRGGSSDGTH
jgi:CheY-like chemotaxis protein